MGRAWSTTATPLSAGGCRCRPAVGCSPRATRSAPPGIAQVHEIVTQLRGEAGPRQVESARVGLAHAVGGFLDGDEASSTVHLFVRERH
jgi:acetyl-CoA acyltransferase